MTTVARNEAKPTATAGTATPAPRRRIGGVLRDDRWPDRFATAMFAFAAFVLVATIVRPLARYLSQDNDVVSMLTLPVVPGFTYAALLTVMAVALRRRLRAAWWMLLIWWLVLPEVGRIVSLASGGSRLQMVGPVLVAAVIVVLVRSRSQFTARRVAGSLLAAIGCFVLGGVVIVVVGTALVTTFGTAPDTATAAAHVLDSMLGEIGRVAGASSVTSPLWVRAVIGLLGAAVILTSTYLLFRAPRAARTLDAAEEARIRTLLRDFGDHDSLGYSSAGLTAYQIGDEAILDLRSFSLNGPGMKAVRQSVARLQRRGYTTVVVRLGDLSAGEFQTLGADAAQWRGDGVTNAGSPWRRNQSQLRAEPVGRVMVR